MVPTRTLTAKVRAERQRSVLLVERARLSVEWCRSVLDESRRMREGEPVEFSGVLHQAAGMVSVQAGCAVNDAYALLDARALGEGRHVNDIADDVVQRRLRFA